MAKPRGDWKKLDKLIKATGRIVSRRMLKESAQIMGDESQSLAVHGAQSGMNPQGRRWKKLRSGRGVALRGMAGTLRLTVKGMGFEIRSSQPWARFQQSGAGRRGTKWRIPKRVILPKRSFPKPWRDPIVAKLNAAWYGNFAKG